MTHRTDVARARDIVARWSVLAGQRLDYLTELYETGRWRRYHSEDEFLENIREAKSAVEVWRSLLDGAATPDNRPVDLSWIGRRSSVPSPRLEGPTVAAVTPLEELPLAPPVSVVPDLVEPEPVLAEPMSAEPVSAEQVSAEPMLAEPAAEAHETQDESALEKTLALTLDIVAMADRYPLLRNAFQGNG